MPLVHVKEDESFENALRRFKRKCEKSGILSELKKRQHYEKPSERRKRKAIAARKKMLCERVLGAERRAAAARDQVMVDDLFPGKPHRQLTTRSPARARSRKDGATPDGSRKHSRS